MPLIFRYAARSDVGLVRSGNEDSGYASDGLLIVADGMGGHAAGELASATVVAILAGLPIAEGDEVLTQLADAVDDAQLEIRQVVAEEPHFRGMGTTVTAVCWQDDRASIAHVGDSRAYMLRGGELLRLTKDHTYVQTLVDAGQITEEQAARHRRRNLLIRAIDGVNTVEPDLSIREVHPGDRLLLCTDGLSGVVPEERIRQILSDYDPTGAVTALVEAALERGAPDNVTCVVAEVAEIAEVPAGNQPVVVGAAAEPRNRSRLPGVEFPEDSQRDTSATAVPLEFAEPLAPAKRRRRAPIVATLLLLLLVVLALGSWFWVTSQYFVGATDGVVTISRGVPQQVGNLSLSSVVAVTDTAVADLPMYAQELVANTIAAEDLISAERVVLILEEQAATCREKPNTAGCPESETAPPRSTTPTATVPTPAEQP